MIKKQFYMGFAGFFGLFSIRYFTTGDLQWLTFIGFFAFFANFILARIKGDKLDERYLQNRTQALAFVGSLAILELFALWCCALLIQNNLLMAVLLSGCYALTLLCYAAKLYRLEEC